MRTWWLSLLIAAPALTACGAGKTPAHQGWPGVNDPQVTVNYQAGLNATARLNEFRVAAGLARVALDYDLSRGCQLHAEYLASNSIDLLQVELAAHAQDPANAHYTTEGDQAAVNSIIFQNVSPTEAVGYWMGTYFHRLGLMDPNLYIIGFGSMDGYQVLDSSRGRVQGAQARNVYVLFPAPGMSNVPAAYFREIPHPVPGDESLGTPITVEFYGDLGRSISDVSAELSNSTTGQPIEHYLSWTGNPFQPDWDPPQVIALIPADPLGPGDTYHVRVTALIDGATWSAGWSFTCTD